jgi:hypothetical protein
MLKLKIFALQCHLRKQKLMLNPVISGSLRNHVFIGQKEFINLPSSCEVYVKLPQANEVTVDVDNLKLLDSMLNV